MEATLNILVLLRSTGRFLTLKPSFMCSFIQPVLTEREAVWERGDTPNAGFALLGLETKGKHPGPELRSVGSLTKEGMCPFCMTEGLWRTNLPGVSGTVPV